LAMGGTFLSYGLEPREALWQVLQHQRRSTAAQGELFAGCLDLASEARFEGLDNFARIREEYAAFGLATHGHPMKALRELLPLPKLTTIGAKKLPNGSIITVAGLILVRQRPPTAKGMTFSTLEDEFGFLDMAIAPDIWEKVKAVFLENCFLEVRGKLQKETNSFSLWVHDLRACMSQEPEELMIEPAQYFW